MDRKSCQRVLGVLAYIEMTSDGAIAITADVVVLPCSMNPVSIFCAVLTPARTFFATRSSPGLAFVVARSLPGCTLFVTQSSPGCAFAATLSSLGRILVVFLSSLGRTFVAPCSLPCRIHIFVST